MSNKRKADELCKRLMWNDLDPLALRTLVQLARQEDLEGWGLAIRPEITGDVTSSVLRRSADSGRANLVAREELVICGLDLLPIVLDVYGGGVDFQPATRDGCLHQKGNLLGALTGPSRSLLEAERVILNFLQRLSGIATTTRHHVQAMGNTCTRLLDTRKTTPGYRVLEKYAVACGGGYNHRIGLFDRVMLKDNHLAAELAAEGEALASLISATRAKWPGLIIELEVDRLEQIAPGLSAGVDIFLLDNFAIEDLQAAVRLIDGRAATEASGGITMESLPQLGSLGLDFISTGATVHKSRWRDIGLDWEEARP